MLHKISAIYRYLKHKETLQESLVIQNPKSPPKSCFSLPPQPYKLLELKLPDNLQEVPPDL